MARCIQPRLSLHLAPPWSERRCGDECVCEPESHPLLYRAGNRARCMGAWPRQASGRIDERPERRASAADSAARSGYVKSLGVNGVPEPVAIGLCLAVWDYSPGHYHAGRVNRAHLDSSTEMEEGWRAAN